MRQISAMNGQLIFLSTGWKARATGIFSFLFLLHTIFLFYNPITLGGTAFLGCAICSLIF
jgi:hypothetical protein